MTTMKALLGILLVASAASAQRPCAGGAPPKNAPVCVPAETQWPEVVGMHLVLDSVQAKYPGNEHAKPCAPSNHDSVCVDDSLPHVTNHLYIRQDHCEQREGVRCTLDQQFFAPINKPVFEEVAGAQVPFAPPIEVVRGDCRLQATEESHAFLASKYLAGV